MIEEELAKAQKIQYWRRARSKCRVETERSWNDES